MSLETTSPDSNRDNTSLESIQEIIVERPKHMELDGFVGLDNIPKQVLRKAVNKGFEFTLMVVGESGLGKSTLVNSMFLTEIYNASDYPGPSQRVKKTVVVETTKVLLKENGVNLLLTVVDTPGFGDAVDNSNCWTPIIEFIESKYEDYFSSEMGVTKKTMPDPRVHCCLYFIQPSGHGLKPLDIEFMKRLCTKVNIIPVIAKGDTLTADECVLFKKQILNEIAQNKIKIYEFPDTSEEEEEQNQNKSLKDRVPFAVVGASTVVEVDGKEVRGRKYPWGIAEVENLDHCDFMSLRNMVICTHFEDFKDVTHNVHYENYKCCKLTGLYVDGKPITKHPLAQMEDEKLEHGLKLKTHGAVMEQRFHLKAREKQEILTVTEADLTRKYEATKEALEAQAKELEEQRRQFEAEKEAWEKEKQVTLEELRRLSLEGRTKEKEGDGKKEKKRRGFFS
ncbi:protein peanut-like [Diabrotica virgifera virgifera]|uniref:Septin n=1 Tax=Diabrotica virgifera virgifera TaxID=50390 RepID=A0A6P7F335_DIAVI|nr:protein peanut-like [Diabrotica virgifera virgifera]